MKVDLSIRQLEMLYDALEDAIYRQNHTLRKLPSNKANNKFIEDLKDVLHEEHLLLNVLADHYKDETGSVINGVRKL